MATIADLMKPYLAIVLPPEAEYADDGFAHLTVTLPKLPNFFYRKSMRFVFDQDVVRLVLAAHTIGNFAIEERVGNYLCDKLKDMIRGWTQGFQEPINNVQLTWHVGSEALDE